MREQRRTVAYLDGFPLSRDLRQARLASHKGMISLQELQSPSFHFAPFGDASQSATEEELRRRSLRRCCRLTGTATFWRAQSHKGTLGSPR